MFFHVEGLHAIPETVQDFPTVRAAEAAGVQCWVQTATTTPTTFGANKHWQILLVDHDGVVIRSLVLPPGRVGPTSRSTRWLVWRADPAAVAPGDRVTVTAMADALAATP